MLEEWIVERKLSLRIPRREKRREDRTDLKFVFVHGLSGWGSYDLLDQAVPYWGFFGGSVIKYLNELGYQCCGASVDLYGSAWDRACELYAQLAGKVVDYGEEHSKRASHPRFGRDFSKDPLMDDFENYRIVLVGHSFGGATVRLFSELLRNGSGAEKEATAPDELSDFFKGGNKDKIFALVTLAAPTNGTTAYDMYDDVTFDIASMKIPPEYGGTNWMKDRFKTEKTGRKARWDYADYDMHIDNALKLNSQITTFDDIYYISYPCSSSMRDMSGQILPDRNVTTGVFLPTAYYMSLYTGVTRGGVVVGEEWKSNDGLVNEISAKAPFGEPAEECTRGKRIRTGVWNVMPTITGDHMRLMGGVTLRSSVNIRPFFTELLRWIADLEKEDKQDRG